MPRIINQQLTKAVVFYFSNPTVRDGTGEIIMGLPECYAAPPGFEKIVCQTAMQAEKWSARMRVWEEAKEQLAQSYQRHQEERQYNETLSEFNHKIANARNQLNRDFMIRAKENFIKRYDDRFATQRTSFLHSEGYSADHKEVQAPKVKLPKKLAQGGVFDES